MTCPTCPIFEQTLPTIAWEIFLFSVPIGMRMAHSKSPSRLKDYLLALPFVLFAFLLATLLLGGA